MVDPPEPARPQPLRRAKVKGQAECSAEGCNARLTKKSRYGGVGGTYVCTGPASAASSTDESPLIHPPRGPLGWPELPPARPRW